MYNRISWDRVLSYATYIVKGKNISYMSLNIFQKLKFLNTRQFPDYDTAVVHSTKYLSKNINKMHPPKTLHGMSPFTSISLQVLMQYYCRLQRYIAKASLLRAVCEKRESICVCLPNILGTICIFGNFHIVFSRCLGSSQQVCNSAHLYPFSFRGDLRCEGSILCQVLTDCWKATILSVWLFKVRRSSDVFLGSYY